MSFSQQAPAPWLFCVCHSRQDTQHCWVCRAGCQPASTQRNISWHPVRHLKGIILLKYYLWRVARQKVFQSGLLLSPVGSAALLNREIGTVIRHFSWARTIPENNAFPWFLNKMINKQINNQRPTKINKQNKTKKIPEVFSLQILIVIFSGSYYQVTILLTYLFAELEI